MNLTNLTEYADYLLQTAMYKEKNISDAEDLVQETLMATLVAIKEGKNIDNPKNWLITVLNRKFYDKLRQKYRMPTVSMDVIADHHRMILHMRNWSNLLMLQIYVGA